MLKFLLQVVFLKVVDDGHVVVVLALSGLEHVSQLLFYPHLVLKLIVR